MYCKSKCLDWILCSEDPRPPAPVVIIGVDLLLHRLEMKLFLLVRESKSGHKSLLRQLQLRTHLGRGHPRKLTSMRR